jgi:hypothetical protein
MASIEDRLAALERQSLLQRDHIDIRQIIASYGPLVDTSDRIERSRNLAMLWVEDGVYDIGGVGAFHGHEAIAAVFADQHFGQVHEGVCHVMGLPVVTIAGDEALALHYSCVFRHDGEGRFYPWRVSANRWDFVRRDGRWLVQRRINRPMIGDPAALAMLESIDGMVGRG